MRAPKVRLFYTSTIHSCPIYQVPVNVDFLSSCTFFKNVVIDDPRGLEVRLSLNPALPNNAACSGITIPNRASGERRLTVSRDFYWYMTYAIILPLFVKYIYIIAGQGFAQEHF